MYYKNSKGIEHKVAISGLKTSICWQGITKSEQSQDKASQAKSSQAKWFGWGSGEV